MGHDIRFYKYQVTLYVYNLFYSETLFLMFIMTSDSTFKSKFTDLVYFASSLKLPTFHGTFQSQLAAFTMDFNTILHTSLHIPTKSNTYHLAHQQNYSHFTLSQFAF